MPGAHFSLRKIVVQSMATLIVACTLRSASALVSRARTAARRSSLSNVFSSSSFPSSARLRVSTESFREADPTELLVGGERYSMVPLPDSMVDTTVFVGNLGEFVNDDHLSSLFASVSSLQSLPACVVRKPDMTSLEYGFVSFPTVQEKESAIIRLDGFQYKGRPLRVEPIRDHPTFGRVRVPERLVDYVSGIAKKTKSGKLNGLRRISCDDVDRLSRGQPSKKRGYGSRNVPHRLNEVERAELNRASAKGFLVLAGTGNRRTRKGSPLANIHRQWCDARGKPQIIVFKAVAGGGKECGAVVDQVVVDLSPLRLHGLFDSDEQVADFLVKWKAEILSAAAESGMEMRDECLDNDDDDDVNECDHDDDCGLLQRVDESSYVVNYMGKDVQEAWASNPIWKLPVVSIGVFEGQRSQAKSMARQLALLWEIPEESKDNSGASGPTSRRDAGAKRGGRTKVKGMSEHRRRGGGHRQAW